MAKIVSILKNKNQVNDKNVDALLIAVSNLSCRSFLELSINEIKKIKKSYSKEIYLLCDKLISESELNECFSLLEECFMIGDLIFFQDLSIYNFAKKNGYIDKLVYYSPTLCVSYQDIEVLKGLGIKNFILSKENTYDDYKMILNTHKDINLGMLCFAYPQIYYSKRKMISSYIKQYDLDVIKGNFKIKEKTRSFFQPIIEDQNGTYIFAGEVFFSSKYLSEFKLLGMELFVIDSSFIDIENIDEMVVDALNGKISDFGSNYLMFEKMVDDYGK